jgi:hypothetical protein
MRKRKGHDEKVHIHELLVNLLASAITFCAQCGYYGESEMTFDVTVKGRETDCPQGWLLDNNDIPSYFTVTYKRIHEFRSCEYIASKAVDDFKRMCRRYKATARYIRVAVSGIERSEIVCEWSSRTHHV